MEGYGSLRAKGVPLNNIRYQLIGRPDPEDNSTDGNSRPLLNDGYLKQAYDNADFEKLTLFPKCFAKQRFVFHIVGQKYPLLRARRRQGYFSIYIENIHLFIKIFGKHGPS